MINFEKITLQHLRGDFFGGLTTGIVALPLALAFGVQSGLGAIYGVYGAIFLGFFAALFGGTRMQISGPTGPMTVLTAAFIAESIGQYGSLELALPFIISTFALVGVFQVLFSVFRLGDLVKFIPYPVISGFMSGIGIIIISLQIYPALGHAAPLKMMDVFKSIHVPLQAVNSDALALSVSTVLLIYGIPKITRVIPSTLIALVVMTFIANRLQMPVVTIGDIPQGFPKMYLKEISAFDWQILLLALGPAITIAAVGSIDSLLTSVVADNMTKTSHHSNQELFGQGLGNFISSLFLGLPGAGATMRTVVNINSGGRGRLSGVIHSLVLLFILLGAGEYAEKIPLSVLAGILITVGISIIDYRGFRYLPYVPRPEAAITLLVTFLTIFVNLLHAVGVGMILACVVFMKRMAEISESKSVIAPIDFQKDTPWYDESTIPLSLKDRVYIKHLNGPLFFAFTSHFQSLVNAIPDIKVVIIRMKLVPYIDQTGLFAMEDACRYLKSKGIQVILTGLQQQPHDMLQETGFFQNVLEEVNCFDAFSDAIYFLENEAKNNMGIFKN